MGALTERGHEISSMSSLRSMIFSHSVCGTFVPSSMLHVAACQKESVEHALMSHMCKITYLEDIP